MPRIRDPRAYALYSGLRWYRLLQRLDRQEWEQCCAIAEWMLGQGFPERQALRCFGEALRSWGYRPDERSRGLRVSDEVLLRERIAQPWQNPCAKRRACDCLRCPRCREYVRDYLRYHRGIGLTDTERAAEAVGAIPTWFGCLGTGK